MRNKTLTRIIIATLLCALLVNAGRATRAFALAQPIEQIQPIYDTEVIALKDYVEQNLDNPNLDVFFLLTGALAVAQLGAQDALLESPYPNETSVKEWIINCGIQLYNSVIGLVPSGDYFVNIPLIGQPQSAVKGIPRSMIKALVAQMMGNAVVARNYSSVEDFLEDDSKHLMPFQRDLQVSINSIWQLQGGPYHWQFDTPPFTSNTVYAQTTMSELAQYSYNSILEQQDYVPIVRLNIYDHARWGQYNARIRGALFAEYHNLFINTLDHYIRFYNDSGQYFQGYESGSVVYPNIGAYYQVYNGTSSVQSLQRLTSNYFKQKYISNYDSFDTIKELVQAFFDHEFTGNSDEVFYEDFIQHVYVGTNWLDKQELFNVSDLNISEDLDDYYKSPDQDVFIDIKDMVENLVNKTSIWDFLIDHLFDIDGNLIIPNFPTFSVDLTPITDLLDPPIPVNMNDIALYTDNDYLEEVKERSRKFGETIGQYFVFWHNSDPVTVYVIFGSFIVILVGLFVGTWRHS